MADRDSRPPGQSIVLKQLEGRSLIVRLPLPAESSSFEQGKAGQSNSLTPEQSKSLAARLPTTAATGSQKSTPIASVLDVPVYDRAFWESFVKWPKIPMSKILNSLGFERTSETHNTSRFTLQDPGQRDLNKSATAIARSLPKTAPELVNAALDLSSFDVDLENLLKEFGTRIWGRECDRSGLAKSSSGRKDYPKDLVFEDASDRARCVQSSPLQSNVY